MMFGFLLYFVFFSQCCSKWEEKKNTNEQLKKGENKIFIVVIIFAHLISKNRAQKLPNRTYFMWYHTRKRIVFSLKIAITSKNGTLSRSKSSTSMKWYGYENKQMTFFFLIQKKKSNARKRKTSDEGQIKSWK